MDCQSFSLRIKKAIRELQALFAMESADGLDPFPFGDFERALLQLQPTLY